MYFARIIAEIVVRLPYDRRRRRLPQVDHRITPLELGLFAAIAVGMGVLPLVCVLTPRFDFANLLLSRPARALAAGPGAVLLLAAVGLFWRAHHDLGTN